MPDIFDSLDIFDKVAKPQSVADIARQRLLSRGLTPEAVKAGRGVTTPDQFSSPDSFGSAGQMIGALGSGVLAAVPGISPVDPTNVAPQIALAQQIANDTTRGNAPGATMARAAVGQVPIVGQPIAGLMAPAMASASNRPQVPEDNLDAIEAAGQIGGAIGGMKLLTTKPSPGGSIGPSLPTSAANLINRYLGDGAIDTTLGKNAGRGISRAKIVAATAEGVQKGVQQSIADGQAVVKRMLSTPEATAPTIDGIQLIRDAFGDPPLNITGATLGRWEEFAGNIAQKVHDISKGTGQLSPAQVDALKGDIDVQFGKLSADATELNLNQKAAAVRRTFDRAVDQNVRGYAEMNDHLADLHHADAVLSEKIAQNATKKPLGLSTVAEPVRSFFGTPASSKGTRPGILTTPGRTALAAMLSERPNLANVLSPAAAAPATANWLDNALREYSSEFIGPPKPRTFRSRPGQPLEFPAAGSRDENDDLFMRRTGDDGKERQFPVPVNPSTLLPEHFVNARAVRYGGPLADYQVQGEPKSQHKTGEIDADGTHGMYGGRFEKSDRSETPNTVLIPASDTDNPQAYAHEVGHAIYDKDLTPAQKRTFDVKVGAAFDAVSAGRASSAIPLIVAKSASEKNRNDAVAEVFGQLNAQYMLNPTAFRAKYPDWYGMYKEFYGGREYIRRSK